MALGAEAGVGQFVQPALVLRVVVLDEPTAQVVARQEGLAVGIEAGMAGLDLAEMRRGLLVQPAIHAFQVDVFGDLGAGPAAGELAGLVLAVVAHDILYLLLQLGGDEGAQRRQALFATAGDIRGALVGGGVTDALALVDVDLGLFVQQGLEGRLGGEQLLALLGGELDIVFAVTVIEQAGQLATVLADQAADEAADVLAQVVVGHPGFVAGFQLFLLVVEVAQHAQVVVEHGEHRMQFPGFAACAVQPRRGGGHFPHLGAPGARRVLLLGPGVAHGGLRAGVVPLHGVDIGAHVLLGGGGFHPLGQFPGPSFVRLAVLRMLLGQNAFADLRHQFGQQRFTRVERGAVRCLQAQGDLAQGDVAHAPLAYAGLRQLGAGVCAEGDFAVQKPGIVALVQGEAGLAAVQQDALVGRQRL